MQSMASENFGTLLSILVIVTASQESNVLFLTDDFLFLIIAGSCRTTRLLDFWAVRRTVRNFETELGH